VNFPYRLKSGSKIKEKTEAPSLARLHKLPCREPGGRWYLGRIYRRHPGDQTYKAWLNTVIAALNWTLLEPMLLLATKSLCPPSSDNCDSPGPLDRGTTPAAPPQLLPRAGRPKFLSLNSSHQQVDFFFICILGGSQALSLSGHSAIIHRILSPNDL
jgi:hypothetical protein